MSSILTSEQIAAAQRLIQQSGSIVITSHKSPDGDAVGSSLALYHLMKALGKENVHVILPDAAPDFLQWVQGYGDIIFFDQNETEATDLINAADLVFCADYNLLTRTGEKMGAVMKAAARPSILIDHHQQPEDFPIVLYSDTSACSTCEMVFRFTDQCGWRKRISLAMAEAIYLGIMTDSGSFRFPSVSPETHEIVAYLMEQGLDHARIHREVYDTNLLDRLKLVGYALSEKLEVIEEAATAIIWLTNEELLRFKHRQGDTEGLVNQALSIKGVKMAVFLREGNNEVKLSFRSKNTFDVNQFARKGWNGGGHKNAAGGSTAESILDALKRLKEEVMEIKNDILAS